MRVADLILAKRYGEALTEEQLRYLVDGYTRGDVPDYQMAAFLMAVVFQGMNDAELGVWVDAMLHSGIVLDLSSVEGPKVDKHSTGGVGDKVSLILAPLAAAAGLKVPMIAGRGLGHTGGTLDKLEAIPGFNTRIPVSLFQNTVSSVGCCIMGQTDEIAPADKKLYALRDVTGTVRCLPLITSSIMSKKMAEGIDALVLDIKVGNGAFMRSVEEATELGEAMIAVGRELGKSVRVLLTDMNQPLGTHVGNALEVIESVEVLFGRGAKDLRDVTVALVADMLELADMSDDRAQTIENLEGILDRGEAVPIFRDMVIAQGGNPDVIDDYTLLPTAEHSTTLDAWDSGFISFMQTTEIGVASVELGAGRMQKEDVIDPAVGFVFHHRLGAKVQKGDPILTIYYNDEDKLATALERLKTSMTISQDAPEIPPLLIERIG